METKDWITLLSAFIIAIGWFVNSALNRKHEIAKKKLEYRLNALESYMPVAFSISSGPNPFKTDPQLLEKLRVAINNINLYGTEEEIKMVHRLADAIQNRDEEEVKISHPTLYECVRSQLRKELGLK